MLTVDTEKELTAENAEEKELPTEISENLKTVNALFSQLTLSELENALMVTSDRSEKVLYRTLLNLKMQLDQEKIINQTLL